MSNAPTEETVLEVEHYTDRLFSFKISRPQSFRFRSGEFIMIGLPALPGKRLYMFSTGTGLAPFASLIRDPETYERYDQVILTHTCRQEAELSYGLRLVKSLKDDPLVGEMIGDKLLHLTSLTREDYPLKGRITTLIENGELFKNAGVPPLNPKEDRVMICGSKDMIDDTAKIVESFGLTEGSNSQPAEFVVEKSFVG